MSLEASSLAIVVKSDGISQATDALNKLATAGDKAERSTNKLAKAGTGAEAAAKKQEKTWYDLLDKVSKAHEREYNMLQRHNNRMYGLVQAEANKMNKAFDRQLNVDAANAARRRKQEQDQLQQLDVLRRNAAAKEYARAQAEAIRMNSMLDRARKQQEAATKVAAERQRVLNSTYATSGLAQQIQTLQRAQAYGNAGGNVSSRFGSNVAGAISSGELQRLQQQYRQLHNEANRANGAMRDTHAAVRGLSGSLGALWLTYGNILPLVAGAAVGAAIKGIVAVGKDIEHTLEKIRVLGQASTAEIDEMRKTVYELGQGVQGPRDVAEALSVLTLAGLNAKEALQGVQGALNLSVVGDIGIEQSAKTLVQVRTALGYTAADFDHIADVIAKTAAVSMSSVESISGAFLSAAAVGEVYGAGLQDIAVGLAAVANLGIQGTAAGTTLKNFYKDLSAGGEKATKVLKDIGLTMRDLKDEDGFFLSMDKLLPKLNDGFSTLNKLARPEAMDKLFGERGVKTGAALIAMINQVSTEVDALGNKYSNKFEEVFDEINKAAAFSTLGAIAMAQTTTNQLKSVGNTLQTVLGQAFAAIAPQIGDVAREMKKAFNSPEFTEGVKSLAIGVANLTKFLVTHLDVIGKVVLAYAAFKLTAFAAGLVEVAKGFTLASISAKAFSLSLGPIAVAIAAMGAAWAIYKANKDKALNNNSAASNLNEFADGVVSAAEKEKEALEMRQKGQSEIEIARKAQMDADREASAAAVKRSQQGLDAMKKQMSEEYASLSDYQKKRVDLVKAGKAQFTGDSSAQKYIELEKGYNAALITHGNQVKIVTAATEALVKTRQKNGELADKAAKQNRIKLTGDNDLTQAPDKAARKLENAIKSETLEMNKAVAQYEAKNAALRETIRLGQIVQADSRQAAVLENLKAGKYGSNKEESNPIYQQQKMIAAQEDALKAENSRLKKYEEFTNKLAETEAAQVAFNQAAADGSNSHIGALRKEAEGMIRLLSLTEEEAASLRKRADAMDAFRKQQEWLTKLESATSNANERAAKALEEAEAMATYGEETKITAISAAELLIQKRKLTEVGAEATKSALREAAATEQLNVAYRDLMKQQVDIAKKLDEAQAESKLVFADSEAEKVRIATQSRNKIVQLELDKAEAAYKAKTISGTATDTDFFAIISARQAADETIRKNEEVGLVETNNLRLKEWKKTVDDIEQIGREGFYNLTEKGVDIWSGMARTFKSMFKTTIMDYIYKEFAKPIMLRVIASLAGFVGADGVATAANAMSGGKAPSTTDSVSKLYNIFKGGGTFESGIAKSVTTGMEKLGFSSGTSSSAGFWAGKAGNVAAGYVAGSAINKTISNGYETGSGMMAVQKVGTAVASYFGPVFGAIAGAIGGTINRLFGMRPKEVTKTGISGAIEGDGKTVSGQAYSMWEQKGGVFRSDKNGIDAKGLDPAIVNSFLAGMAEIKAASATFAGEIGVSADVLIGYGKQFDIVFGDNAEDNQKAIEKLFTDIGDELATKLIPNIMDMAKQGESASQVLERLGNTFSATKNVADILGKSVAEVFGGDGLSSEKARTKFVDMSGGADAVTQKASAYVNAIYSDTQKLAPVQKALAEAMAELNQSSVKTKEQFKAVVDSLNLTNEADIRLFNSLMELAPAFAEVNAAAEELLSKRLALEARAAELTENSAEAARVLAAQRVIELSVLDSSLHSLQQYVWGLEDAADVAEKAKEAEEKLAEARKEAMDKVIDAADAAYDRISKSVGAEKEKVDAFYSDAIENVRKKAKAEKEAAEKQLEAAEKQRDAIKNIVDNLASALKSTQVESMALTKARRIEAQSYLQVSAVQVKSGGNVTKLGGLDNALEAIAKPSEDLYSTFEEYARDQAMTANVIESLYGSAENQLSTAELTISKLNATIEAIDKNSTDTIDKLEQARKDEIEALDKILEKAQEQLDALKGVDSSLLGLTQALNNFAAKIAAGNAQAGLNAGGDGAAAISGLYQGILGRAPDAAGSSFWQGQLGAGVSVGAIADAIQNSPEAQTKTVMDVYQNVLGRPADLAGLNFWKGQLANGVSVTAIEAAIRGSEEKKTNQNSSLPSFAVGTNYVPRDMVAQIHQGERIVPAADNAAIMRSLSNNGESTEAQALRQEISDLKQILVANGVATVQAIKDGNKVLKKWDQEGQPEQRDMSDTAA